MDSDFSFLLDFPDLYEVTLYKSHSPGMFDSYNNNFKMSTTLKTTENNCAWIVCYGKAYAETKCGYI